MSFKYDLEEVIKFLKLKLLKITKQDLDLSNLYQHFAIDPTELCKVIGYSLMISVYFRFKFGKFL